jgi:hypothetical protein
MTDAFYNAGKSALQKNDLLNVTVKLAILNSSYVPDIDADEFWDDVSSFEVSGTGYPEGGETLSPTITEDDANDKSMLDVDDFTISSATFNDGKFYVIYIDTGTPGTSPLLCYFELEAAQSPSSEDYDVSIHANGLWRL